MAADRPCVVMLNIPLTLLHTTKAPVAWLADKSMALPSTTSVRATVCSPADKNPAYVDSSSRQPLARTGRPYSCTHGCLERNKTREGVPIPAQMMALLEQTRNPGCRDLLAQLDSLPQPLLPLILLQAIEADVIDCRGWTTGPSTVNARIDSDVVLFSRSKGRGL